MSSLSDRVTPDLLREWGVPDPGESKKDRGQVVVVGGSRRTPGAVMLALEAALRVGSGRVGAIVPGSIDAHLGAALPEAAIFALPDEPGHGFDDSADGHLRGADAVLVGPGFDDPEETLATLRDVIATRPRRLVLDAYGLGVLPRLDRDDLPDELILTPNREELAILLDEDDVEDLDEGVRRAARMLRATITCYGIVAGPDGEAVHIEEGGPGLGTAGSGDVLAGAVAGMLSRGMPAVPAVARATWLHARAGDRLTERMGLGFLARELARELAATAQEIDGVHDVADDDAGSATEPARSSPTTAQEQVAGWLAALARPAGDVGGGAGCAVLTAVSASLLGMVAGYADDEGSRSAAVAAAEVRTAVLGLADLDGKRSGELGDALRTRDDVADAARDAAAVALRIGELGATLAEPWQRAAAAAKAYLSPDIVVGVGALSAGLRGALATAAADAELASRHGGDVDVSAGGDSIRAAQERLVRLLSEHEVH